MVVVIAGISNISFRMIPSIRCFVIARLANCTLILTNGLVSGYRLINLNSLKARLQASQQLATREKKRIDYFVEIALLQLVSSVTVFIFIPYLPARSKGAKRYDLKCLSTLPLRLPGLLFPKEFQSMIFSRPANKYLNFIS